MQSISIHGLSSMKRYQKILLGCLAAALLATAGIQVYFAYYLDDQLKQTVILRFNAATDNAYELQINEFDLQILGRRLVANGISVTSRDDATDANLRASLDRLRVSGIGFLKLMISQQLSLRTIELVKPEIHLTTSPTGESSSENKKLRLTDFSRRLSEITLQVLKNVTVPRLLVRDFSAEYNRSDLPVRPYLSFDDSYIELRDIAIDSSLITDKRILPAKQVATVFRDVRYQTPNELYTISAGQVNFSSQKQQLDIQSLALIPRYNRQAFADKVPHEVDRFRVDIPKIICRQIDVARLNRAERLAAHHVDITQPDIDIYRDKRPPFPPNNHPPLPQQMVRDIPFPLNIDSLAISNGHIRYSERVPKAEEAGHITFADLSARLQPLSNLEDSSRSNQDMTLTAETSIMGQAKLQAKFRFPAKSKRQYIEGTLGPMNMLPLNSALVPMAFIRIDDGKIRDMDFRMNLGPTRASGTVQLRYRDLKISLLDKESNEETFGNKLKSLLANTFAVKSSNIGDDLRTGTVDFERDREKSTFNYWWKALLSGLKSNVGL